MPQRTGHLIVDIGKLSGKQEIVRLPEALKIIARKVHGKCFELCRKLRKYMAQLIADPAVNDVRCIVKLGSDIPDRFMQKRNIQMKQCVGVKRT